MEREEFEINCRIVEAKGEKDILKIVVRRNEVRGGVNATRLGGLVVPTVLSCLGISDRVGRIDRGFDCKNWGKSRIFDQKGGIILV